MTSLCSNHFLIFFFLFRSTYKLLFSDYLSIDQYWKVSGSIPGCSSLPPKYPWVRHKPQDSLLLHMFTSQRNSIGLRSGDVHTVVSNNDQVSCGVKMKVNW